MIEPRKIYQEPVSDSLRWSGFVHRPGDIYICTPPKTGTTWTQAIVASLLWPDGKVPGVIWDLSPWLDANFEPIDHVLARLDAQKHRRFIKTHTPADGIPWFDTGSYIAVARPGLDAFMSMENHLTHMRDEVIDALNEQASPKGLLTLPPYDGDLHGFFSFWVADARYLNNVATWWERRHEPNLLLVHYNDLKADLEGEMRRVADFLDIEVPSHLWPAVVERCTFAAMKARMEEIGDFDKHFEGGGQAFLFKGTNGRWRDVLTDDEVASYHSRVREVLSDEAADWLEHGSLAVGHRPR